MLIVRTAFKIGENNFQKTLWINIIFFQTKILFTQKDNLQKSIVISENVALTILYENAFVSVTSCIIYHNDPQTQS